MSGFTSPRRGISLSYPSARGGGECALGNRQQPGGVDFTRTTHLADDGRHRQHPGAVVHYPAPIAKMGHRPAGKGSGRSRAEEPDPAPGPLVHSRHRRRCRGAAFQSGRNQGRCTVPAVMVAGAGRRPRA